MSELENIKDGVVPKSRLADAESARAIFSNLVKEDDPASLKRSRVQGLIDGNPPRSDAELRKNSQAWMPNANWGGAEARISDALTPYFDLLTASPCIVSGCVYYGDTAQRSEWASAISEEFHRTLFEWQGFIPNELLHQKQLVTHGLGPCIFRNPRDWRPTALKRRAILVPSDSSANMDAMDMVFVRDSMRVHELFAFIEDKETARAMGWNVEVTLEAIQEACPEDKDSNFEAIQEQFKNNSFGWGYNKGKATALGHAYVTEFGGKVSHHIFTQNGSQEKYLYSKIGQYDSLAEALWLCFDDIGNGDFHSQRGLGNKIAQFYEAQNRLNNHLLMNAILGSTPMFQAENAETVDRLAQFEAGPFRVLPSGVTPMPLNLGTGIQSALTVSQQLSMLESNQTGSYRNQGLAPRGVERTAKEISTEVTNSSKLSNTKVSFYLLQKDQLFMQMYKRLIRKDVLDTDPGGKAALEFRKRLEERGVPQKAIESFVPKLTRPIGNGSEADRMQRMALVREFIGDMPERKRAQFVRDSIAYAAGNREAADRYGPDLEPQGPTVHEKLAMFENDSLARGADPAIYFNRDDPHAIHFEVHRNYVTQLLQSDSDPQQIATAMESFGPHMAAHLKGLEKDPTRKLELDMFKEEFSEIMKAADQVASNAESMQESEVPPERDPEMIKALKDVQIKERKFLHDASVKDRKAAHQISLKNATAINDARIKNATAKATR